MSRTPSPEGAPLPRAHPLASTPARRAALPEPIRFMLTHAAIGMAIGAVAGLALIAGDGAGLGRLLAQSPSGPIAGGALLVLLAGTGGGIQIAMAIGLMEQGGGRPAATRRPAGDGIPRPLPVRAPRRPNLRSEAGS